MAEPLEGDFWDGTYLVEEDGKLIRKRTEPVCDFCCEKITGTCWTYPCGFVVLPLLDDPTGLPGVSDDPWCCCQTCKPLVDEKDWQTLAARTANNQISMAGWTSKVPPDLYLKWLSQLVLHFQRFDAARNGEPYEEPQANTD